MSVKKLAAVVSAALLFVPVHAALAPRDQTTVARFRQLRSEAVAAAAKDELQIAGEKLAAADALIRNHPGLVLLRARVALAAGDPRTALAQLRRYADMGLSAALLDDKGFEPLQGSADYGRLKSRLLLNRKRSGELREVASVAGLPLIEGLVWDEARKRLLVSAVHGRSIFELGSDGALKPYLESDAAVLGVLGLAADEARNTLWAATSGLPQAGQLAPEQAGRSELLRINLASGKILARYAVPGEAKRSFGDVALGRDGTVLVSDSLTGDVFRLRPRSKRLEPLVSGGWFGSAQGIVIAPGSRSAVISDYGSGLHVVSLVDGSVSPVATPSDVSLLGIDAMIAKGDAILAVQNGVTPQRILRLAMSPDFRSVLSVTVLAANHPLLDEPSGLLSRGDAILLVARSQWSAFKDDGQPLSPSPQPAAIVQLILPATR
jgi:hypothetical protein